MLLWQSCFCRQDVDGSLGPPAHDHDYVIIIMIIIMIRQISPKIQFTPKLKQIRENSERSHYQTPVQLHTGSNPANACFPRTHSTNISIAVSTMIEVVIIVVIEIAMQAC